MSYFALHRRNTLERIPISRKEILPGDIIEFRYTKKDGKKDLVIALCLDGLAGRFTTDNKLNAIKLENFSMNVLKRFIQRIEKPALVSEARKGKELIGLSLNAKSEGERQVFYNKIVKRFNQYDAYRTFIGEKMTAIKLLNYDWVGNAGQLGLKDEDLLQDTDT
tara:strand:+ start:1112 stop:1603 length:492 start_codon:yes stop_codon:yes gene_type:complete